jgi:hypothetical protein
VTYMVHEGPAGPFHELEAQLVESGVIRRDPDNPLWLGLMLADSRLQLHGIDVPPSEAYRNSVLMTIDLLRDRGVESARGIALLLENVLIASAMRSLYGETALGVSDLNQYYETSRWFHNSFWHD